MSVMTEPVCLRRPALAALCVRGVIARGVMAHVAKRVDVDILLPDGSLLGRSRSGPRAETLESTEGAPVSRAARPAIEIVRPAAFFERVGHNPKVGVGEGYMAGDWRAADGTDLADALHPFAQQVSRLVPATLRKLRFLADKRIPEGFRNTLPGARRNIEAHYDLSNEMFATFLDGTMTYSSAYFSAERDWSEQSLEEAQLRKVERVLDEAQIHVAGDGGPEREQTVLEIGTGWGTLAIAAAQRGARVLSVTLSQEQAALARERAEEAGVADLIDVRVQDYREVEGQYDAVVSVEMIEAVGEDYWPTYARTLQERLAPGGVAVVQAIVMDHHRYLASRRSYGWINKHIFPGGIIPSEQAFVRVVAEHTDLQLEVVDRFADSYAETLRRWRAAFLANWPRVEALGFDETFQRMWEFYLAYCQAGFAAGAIDVAHWRLQPKPAAT